jgi:hypothetical protein
MNSWVQKLNLRPNELRLVVVVASVIIAVLYALFIWPQFKEWGQLRKKRDDLQMIERRNQKEIDKTSTYQRELAALRQKGHVVESEAQALDTLRAVQSQAVLNNVSIITYTPGKGPATSAGRTNSYFEESTSTISYQAEETNLVNFLYALTSGDSLIRVASMTVNPDPGRMKLMGNMTLVASYPKKAPPKTAAPPGAPAAAPGAAMVRPAGPAAGPRTTIPGALAAKGRAGPTNPPPSSSWWGKVKSLFTATPSTNAPAKTPPSAKPAVPTNAPPLKTKK